LADGLRKCRSCGAAIYWVTMVPSMKPMSLDAKPAPGGNIERRKGKNPNSRRWYGRVIPAADRELFALLYVSHFATCPDAKKWRGDRSNR
jgi:hypothetical protein